MMIQGHNIICFSSDWQGDPLSKQHMLRLAKYNRILWVNSSGAPKPDGATGSAARIPGKMRKLAGGNPKMQAGIHVHSPIALPFAGVSAARWVNQKILKWSIRRVCRKLGFHDSISWVFLPLAADVAGLLGEQMLVYHCVDESAEPAGIERKTVLELERRLVEKSDYVIVSSDRLLETRRAQNANTFLVTHGIDVAHFRKACDPLMQIPEELKRLKGPVLGFVGSIADWVDLELIRFLAVSRPDWNIVLIGKVMTDLRIFDGLPNIHLLGRRPYDSLPAYARGFATAILPFVVNELSAAANPLKLQEYLAAGLPVVATAVPEANKLQHMIRIARHKLQFLEHVHHILKHGQTGPQIAISRRMDGASWDAKVEEICRILSSEDERVA